MTRFNIITLLIMSLTFGLSASNADALTLTVYTAGPGSLTPKA